MEKMFCLGLVFGAVGGALLVANSYKMRSLGKKIRPKRRIAGSEKSAAGLPRFSFFRPDLTKEFLYISFQI